MSFNGSGFNSGGGKAQPKTVSRRPIQEGAGAIQFQVYANDHPTYPSEVLNTTFDFAHGLFYAGYAARTNGYLPSTAGTTTYSIQTSTVVPDSQFVQMIGIFNLFGDSLTWRNANISIDGQSIDRKSMYASNDYISASGILSWYGYGPSLSFQGELVGGPNIGGNYTIYIAPIAAQTLVDDSGEVFHPPGLTGAYAAASYS